MLIKKATIYLLILSSKTIALEKCFSSIDFSGVLTEYNI